MNKKVLRAMKWLYKLFIGADYLGWNVDVLAFGSVYDYLPKFNKYVQKKFKLTKTELKKAVRMAYDSYRLGVNLYAVDSSFVQQAVRAFRETLKEVGIKELLRLEGEA